METISRDSPTSSKIDMESSQRLPRDHLHKWKVQSDPYGDIWSGYRVPPLNTMYLGVTNV